MQPPRPGPAGRDPRASLAGCDRIVVVGRTGSGKTTLARELADGLGVAHIELDALFFGPGFVTVPVETLRERVGAAVAGPRWVADGNKAVVRDLVWARADTVVWLDYPLWVSLPRLAGRAGRHAAALGQDAAAAGSVRSLPGQVLAGGRGVLTALRSHRGQRRLYPQLLAAPEHRHLALVRLRSPGEAARWLEGVVGPRSGRPPAPQ